MCIVNVWWAGHKLQQVEVSHAEINIIVEQWQNKLDSGEEFFTSVGVKMRPTGLCIDVFSEGKLILQRDLKRS